ncbi:hypothetical protein JOE44_001935 [Chryseobacterium sp. PvR013]|uniref:hypothetical protein n=1 Tax=Chryseobacterium sp. PvR013 TaxID=2806595 RepID=UPI001AE93365|nr:hypothetical protein [Chryseobacterium sp. PvR013]MBP1165051.1 hypothetical protein [Chryseobacterium sp. PvR013]
MEKKIYMLIIGDFADRDTEAVFDNEEDLQEYLNNFDVTDIPMHIEVKYLNPKPGGKTEPDYNDERYPVFNKKKS